MIFFFFTIKRSGEIYNAQTSNTNMTQWLEAQQDIALKLITIKIHLSHPYN